MSRKNSRERGLSFEIKDSRSFSIGSNGSIETINLEENKNPKHCKRRKRENNIENYKRRNTPDLITAKNIIDRFKEAFINK